MLLALQEGGAPVQHAWVVRKKIIKIQINDRDRQEQIIKIQIKDRNRQEYIIRCIDL
jgi:hypothetical protein